MKRTVLLCILVCTSVASFAQWGLSEAYPGVPLAVGAEADVWGPGVLGYRDSTVTRRLPQGTIVLGERAGIEMRDLVNGEFDDLANIEYQNIRYTIRTSDLAPINGVRLPRSWITANTDRTWMLSYYLNVLHSQNRDTFLNYERAWIDWYVDRWYETLSLYGEVFWYEQIFKDKFESLVFFDAVVFMGGFERNTFFITDIAPLGAGYKITMSGDRLFAIIPSHFIPDTRLPFPLWEERKSFDMIFIPDGDFMDVYLDSLENHFATFAKVDAVILEELERLVQTNDVDVSRITFWPRRADGSIDIPPPDGVSLAFRASHRTTDRLRVRDNPTTDANIVTTLDLGAEVQILETGSVSTIAGITASWVRLLTSEGYTGWSFSGFLETVAVSGGVTEIQPAVVAASIVAPVNIAAESSPATSAMPLWAWLAIGGGALAAVGGVLVARRKR